MNEITELYNLVHALRKQANKSVIGINTVKYIRNCTRLYEPLGVYVGYYRRMHPLRVGPNVLGYSSELILNVWRDLMLKMEDPTAYDQIVQILLNSFFPDQTQNVLVEPPRTMRRINQRNYKFILTVESDWKTPVPVYEAGPMYCLVQDLFSFQEAG